MKRPAGLSLSLSPCESAQDPVHQRICNSAPSRVISDQDEDWNWGSLEASNESTISLGSCALYTTEEAWTDRLIEDDQEAEDEDTRDAAPEDTVAEIEIAVSDQPAELAGDFSDFIDPMSPDSKESNVLYSDSDSDEPYEYWTKPWSYSRSPFSNCSSLSYEDSDDDENVAIHNSISPTEVSSDETKCMLPLASASSSTPAPKLTRFSDVGPGVMRGLTAMIHGTTSFKGPTSI